MPDGRQHTKVNPMTRLKAMAPLGVFALLWAMFFATLFIPPLVAPDAVCNAIDPDVTPIMDSYGGKILRSLYSYCGIGF